MPTGISSATTGYILCWEHWIEFSRNTQCWQHWHLIQVHQNIQRMKNDVIFLKIPMYYIQKKLFSPKQSSVYFNYYFRRKWIIFPPLNIFDAFGLDVNIVNFVYYGKTRTDFDERTCWMVSTFNHRPSLVHVDISTTNSVGRNIDSETAFYKAFQTYQIFLYTHLLKDIYNLIYIGSPDHRGLWWYGL